MRPKERETDRHRQTQSAIETNKPTQKQTHNYKDRKTLFFFFCVPQLYLWGSPFW